MAGTEENLQLPEQHTVEIMAPKPISAEEFLDEFTKRFNNTQHKTNEIDIVELHLRALDDLVNVNSLFTVAVFVGLSMALPGQISLENRPECNADAGMAKRLVTFEVLAFACFLLSSLSAKVLKLQLNIYRTNMMVPSFDYKDLMLSLSAMASVAGIVLLTLSVVDVIQIRIGRLSCGSVETLRAVVALCSIVGFALIIYVVSMAKAIHVSFKCDILYAVKK